MSADALAARAEHAVRRICDGHSGTREHAEIRDMADRVCMEGAVPRNGSDAANVARLMLDAGRRAALEAWLARVQRGLRSGQAAPEGGFLVWAARACSDPVAVAWGVAAAAAAAWVAVLLILRE